MSPTDPSMVRPARAADAWRRADAIGERLRRARDEPLGAPSLSAERAEELVAAIQSDREDRGARPSRGKGDFPLL